MDRIRNEEMRRRAGMERELASRADKILLRWLGVWGKCVSTVCLERC